MWAGRWSISANTEILFMSLIGVGMTMLEDSLMNVKETLAEIWSLSFSDTPFTMPIEHVIKSVMSGIVLLRAFTIHLYLASYLLLMYPVIMERMRVMMAFWLGLSAVRSILVNLAAALAGCLICSSYAQLKTVCFEFVAVKAVELACSVYMWVNVHDLYYDMKRRRLRLTESAAYADVTEEGKAGPSKKKLETGEDASLIGSDSEMDDEDSNLDSLGSESLEALSTAAALQWFIAQIHMGIKECHSVMSYEDETLERVSRMLGMSPEDLALLQDNLKRTLVTLLPKQPAIKDKEIRSLEYNNSSIRRKEDEDEDKQENREKDKEEQSGRNDVAVQTEKLSAKIMLMIERAELLAGTSEEQIGEN